MPTTIPFAHRGARAATYAGKSRWGRFVAGVAALGHRVRDELQGILTSNEFRTVATFSLIGLLVGLLAMLSGMEGVWM